MSPTPPEQLLHRLMVGDAATIAAIVDASRGFDEVAWQAPHTFIGFCDGPVKVDFFFQEGAPAADPWLRDGLRALFDPDGAGLMARAGGIAATTRDRQLVAIAGAHLRGERDLVDALARDHLVDHPDSVLVAWIAGASHRNAASPNPPSNQEPS